jgi:hypothetical protein
MSYIDRAGAAGQGRYRQRCAYIRGTQRIGPERMARHVGTPALLRLLLCPGGINRDTMPPQYISHS